MGNPLKYTDPDGQFWHLIIGAVIGGTVNWISHGAKLSWKGLGYFGVGAAAGALGAGVGAGVNAAIAGNAAAGGGFFAGFAGTATISSTGFIAGAATGASGGFAGGFINGFGNAGMDGQSFGKMLGSGVKEGGIHASKNNRKFWSGSYKTYKIPDAPLFASTENGVAINQDGFTVQNNSGETIYYKPETTDPIKGLKGDGAYPIKNGEYIKNAVDGVTAPGKNAQVFKITDPFNTSSIRVSYSNVSIDMPYVIWELSINKALGGGWLAAPPDGGWNQIFKMAGYVFK